MNEIFTSPQFWAIFIPAVVAVITLYLTKKYEIESEWRKQKLNHYKVLLSSISDLAIDDTDKDEANLKFALATNTIALVAPQQVITALMAFHDYTQMSNPNQTIEKHDELLIKLLLEIRRDLGVSKKDNPSSFTYHLVGSRNKKNL
ncbi:MAG: hypothetical protein GX587_07505 [Bacteroidales bacterium]|nr:hypothetical protein [Bacteroidales bacterium]